MATTENKNNILVGDLCANKIWRSCILGSLAHAIMVSNYPVFSYEQCWDGDNYCLQDGCGQRGTVSFSNGSCVAAFRNEKSARMSETQSAMSYFAGAPKDIIRLAETETLQYLLDNDSGVVAPKITAAFWGSESLYSIDSIATLFNNGMGLLKRQLMESKEAIAAWIDYYSMAEAQIALLKALYYRKVNNPDDSILLTYEELQAIDFVNKDGEIESRKRFKELAISWSD